MNCVLISSTFRVQPLPVESLNVEACWLRLQELLGLCMLCVLLSSCWDCVFASLFEEF